MPEPVTQSLRFSSLSELKENAIVKDEKLKNMRSIDDVKRIMKKMYERGKQKLKEGDQETAYIYFFRVSSLLPLMNKFPEFQENQKYYKLMIGKVVLDALNNVEELNNQLACRYEQKNSKKPIIEKGKEENQTVLENINGFTERTELSSKELYHLLSKRVGNQYLLIIDIRLKEEFNSSHMLIDDVINIPENTFKPGMTASQLENHLEEPIQRYFKKRDKYDWIIIVDWCSKNITEDQQVPIVYMFRILTKWDRNRQYKHRPRILEGGYEDWLSKYPQFTSDPNITTRRLNPRDIESDLSDIDYPDLSFKTVSDAGEKKSIQVVDRSTKPTFYAGRTENNVPDALHNSLTSGTVKSVEVQSVENNNNSNLTHQNNGTEPKNNLSSAEVNNECSDTDEEELLEKYSQKGRRSAVVNAASKYGGENGTKNVDGVCNNYRDEEDVNETGSRNLSNILNEDVVSNMKRSSSTPNISKLDNNQRSVPTVDRSTKPSNDDQLNIYNSRNREEIGKGLVGLKNLGNTCYMNSIIQCLSNTEPLRKRLCASGWHTNDRSKTRGMIAREVRNIISQLWSGDSGSVSCKALKTTISEYRDTFKGYEQQDSHEFLTILIDGLHEDLNCTSTPHILHGADDSSGEKSWGEFISKNSSIVRELFYGQLKSTVCCSECGKESITFEPFSNLSLPLPTEERCTLAECLRLYISNESIPGWKCPTCNKPRNATKKLDITKLPPILVIHFKRFTSDGWCRKRLTNVDFPNLLDMTPFISGQEHRDRRYQLYAVSNHFGTMESGHYTAYCLNTPTQKWYKFDDQDVSPLLTVPKSSSAYIVFYQSLR